MIFITNDIDLDTKVSFTEKDVPGPAYPSGCTEKEAEAWLDKKVIALEEIGALVSWEGFGILTPFQWKCELWMERSAG